MTPWMQETVRWLEKEGWDLLPGDGLQARRERGERVEILRAIGEGRLRYTLTQSLGDEEFRRTVEENVLLRAVSRMYRETTVTAEFPEGGLRTALQAAQRAARQPGEA